MGVTDSKAVWMHVGQIALGVFIGVWGTISRGWAFAVMGGMLAYFWCVSWMEPNLFISDGSAAAAADIPQTALDVLSGIVILAGTATGAGLMLLWRSISIGVISGFLTLALLMLLVGGASFAGAAFTGPVVVLLACLAGVGALLLAYRGNRLSKQRMNVIVTSAFGSLVLACSYDPWGARDFLLGDLAAVSVLDWAAIGHCSLERGGCHPRVALGMWLVSTFFACLVQVYLGGDPELRQQVLALLRRDHHPYQSLPDAPTRRSEASKQEPAAIPKHLRQDSNKFKLAELGVNILDLRHPVDAEEDGRSSSMDEEESKLSATLLCMFEEIQDVFGFQTHSGVNQVEHLVLLLLSQKRYEDPAYRELMPAGKGPLSDEAVDAGPVKILHDKLFKNYKRWCASLKVAPHFDTIPHSESRGTSASWNGSGLGSTGGKWFEREGAKVKMHNLLLFLLIWGEAGNLRHMPECIAWLYHTTAACFKGSTLQTIEAVEEEYFLTHAVTPIYAVVAVDMKKSRMDHVDKKNYDDFNEFFWSRQCLAYTWTPEDMPAVQAARAKRAAGEHARPGGGETDLIARALKGSPKTFMEKRSWLMIMLAFRRLIDFHVVTFFILAVQGFWLNLQWDDPYYYQLMSSVFMLMNSLGIFWATLEIWATMQDKQSPCPPFEVRGEAKHGVMLRLLTRFVFLLFQARYFGLSLEADGLDLLPDERLSDKSAQLEAWWMYVWISVALHSVWILDCVFQACPPLSTQVFETRNHYVKALLDIIFPQMRTYTGKRVHEPFHKWCLYFLFWSVVITAKICFSYQFEVSPLALPALELADDQVNYLNKNLYLTILLIIVRWLPFVAIYSLDMIIVYSLVAGVVGLLVGLYERLGQVCDFAGIREHFMRTPESFYSRLIYNSEDRRPKHSRKASHVSDLGMSRRFTSSRNNLLAAVQDDDERKPLVATNTSGMQRLGNGIRSNYNGTSTQPHYEWMNCDEAFLDIGTTKWYAFATAWNKIVENLRETDIISNDERDMLLFYFFKGLSKSIYLPVFQTAGYVEKAARLCAEKGKEFRALPTDNVRDGDQSLKQKRDAIKSDKQRVDRELRELLNKDRTAYEAVAETLELTLDFLRRMLGPKHAQDVLAATFTLESFQGSNRVMTVERAVEEGNGQGMGLILESLRLENVEQAVEALGKAVSALKSGLPRRVINPKRVEPVKMAIPPRERGGMVTVGSSMRRVRSKGFMSNLSLSSQDLVAVGEQAAEGAVHQSPAQPQVELDSLRDKIRDSLRIFLSTVKGIIVPGAPNYLLADVATAITNVLNGPFFWDDYYASEELDRLAESEAKSAVMPVLAKLQGLLTLHVGDAEPKSAEARRRLSFFVNSLFMDVPKAPSISDMMSWTVITPFYSEDVLYNRKDLEAANEDGVNTLLYLQTLYKSDWKNFQERLGLRNDSTSWAGKAKEEIRLWASMRAQTLSRTVQGMMYYEDALHMLSVLDRDPSLMPNAESNSVQQLIKRKFGYVVACQVYGKLKKEQDSKADDIDFLLRRFPSLRVAYIDERQSKSGESSFFSVLIRANDAGTGIEEIYRVRLPGNPVLGEGKPENQNHAMIFSRGEHVQAIDMNQEGYFEDAYKMRNFLQEFALTGSPDMPTTILGFREHIFTGAVSSLANYMALQEYSFVTLGQRVLNRPLRMRLHYGHPDLFDKLFFMQNGGISKASKGINLSEDIFAGYNNLLRGGSVEFKEYVQVGKGRDVGMQQIYKFEAKLSQGAAEQSISRDVYRMVNRVDFFRLLTYYFGGIGHYLSSVLTVAAIWLLVYVLLSLSLFQHEKIGDRPMVPIGTLQMVLAGVGILQTMPLFCALLLERGVWASLTELAQVFISGGPLYFVFHIRTRDYYYSQTILAGGAAYKATGRGFVTQHASFAETFRYFAASHLYLGLEMVAALVLFACYTDAGQYVGRTWSLWFAAVAFLYAPFWFNPMSFEWERVREDVETFVSWMCTTGGSTKNSWESWWKEENGWIKALGPTAKAYLVGRSCTWLVVAAGLLYKPLYLNRKFSGLNYLLFHLGILLGLWQLYRFLDRRGRTRNLPLPYCCTRPTNIVIGMGIVFLVALIIIHSETIKFFVALYYLGAWMTVVLSVLGFREQAKIFHWIHDWVLAVVLIIPIFLCTILQFPRHIQTWLLYHNALSQGVVISDLIRHAQNSREMSNTDDERAQAPRSHALASALLNTPSSVNLRSAYSPASGGPMQISPEEKTRERLVGSGCGSGFDTTSGASCKRESFKSGQTRPDHPQSTSQRPHQDPSPVSPAASEQSPEVFQFRQPTNFPTRE
ncbi:hypothetical protein NSK_004943 [Nannochloropsis salina CCMP1776]|uniref:1,3-beta-glucan synthase n=1 Tax=Nannochloropsis salina CCMP1776 TaxID=1027361 RepID=A0A4D9CXW2_9STRA|nr:hypothetical protein NSK_004943 [Nannochloropsis salina CCMP1776]|eukprot:TFJ83846.1 hypothetical protein NSK_004943 [Nannochloropsis salina CCMP1776]